MLLMNVIIYGYICFAVLIVGVCLGYSQTIIRLNKNQLFKSTGGSFLGALGITGMMFGLAGYVYGVLILNYNGFPFIWMIPALVIGFIGYAVAGSQLDKWGKVEEWENAGLKKHIVVGANISGILFVMLYHILPDPEMLY